MTSGNCSRAGEQRKPCNSVRLLIIVLFGIRYTREIMYDITLHVGQPVTPLCAHRTVLATFCTYFEDLFRRGRGDTPGTELMLPEISAVAMKELLKWFYTGDICINYENVLPILDAACKLGCPKVEKRAQEMKDLLLSDENVMSTLEVSARPARGVNVVGLNLFSIIGTGFRTGGRARLPAGGVRSHVRAMVCARRHAVVLPVERRSRHTSSLLRRYRCQRKFRKSLKLNANVGTKTGQKNTSASNRTQSEVDVFDAAINWMTVDRSTREQFFLNLVDCTRWPWMNQEEYLRCVDKEPNLTRKKESKRLVTEANW